MSNVTDVTARRRPRRVGVLSSTALQQAQTRRIQKAARAANTHGGPGMVDVMVDLMHLHARNGGDPIDLLGQCREHYAEETR